MDVVVTGVGLALAGAEREQELLGHGPDPKASVAPFDPAARIGGRGLRYKDRASQLALCAAADALAASGLVAADGRPTVNAASVGVTASSNTGNLDTVCLAASMLNEETSDGLSPMSLPNASSNVVASSVAMQFGLRGPNLMLCNGPTSGLDAVYWATQLLAGGRCESAVVIGTEPRNAVVARLCGVPEFALFDGAAAVVLEGAAAARGRGATPAARLGRFARERGLAACITRLLGGDGGGLGAWFTPESYNAKLVAPDVPRYDLSATFGLSSGALGVLQCVAAVGWLTSGGTGTALITTGDEGADAVSALLVFPACERADLPDKEHTP